MLKRVGRQLVLLPVVAAVAVLAAEGSARPAAAQARFLDPDGNELPFATYGEVEQFLADADIVSKDKIAAGTNKNKRRVVLEKNGQRARAVLRTSYEIKDAPGGGFVDSYKSELAAYEMAKLLGLDNVPPVVQRKGGSLQIWIENATTDAHRRNAEQEPVDPLRFEAQIRDMNVFDNLIANTDRNPGNILIDENGKVWFIDHTRSFAGQLELKYPDKVTGCSEFLWKRLREVTDAEIRDAVGPYARSYVDELLVRRRLLVELIAAKIAEVGVEDVIFTSSQQ